MMTEMSERGIAFVCEVCGWHTTERRAAVAHALKAHGGATGRRSRSGGIEPEPGRAWRAMIRGAYGGEC
jgi:hypothetical protein|nr:MAG TPA: hypothetical protein [Caudoviricetes sp.]